MEHWISRMTGSHGKRGLVAVAAVALLVAGGSTGAEAKMSPPEQLVKPDKHKVWPEPGPVHPNDDICTMGGPTADASANCDVDLEIDGSAEPDGSTPPPWGGPGERIAVGRDRDSEEEAQAEAEAEADETCHGRWARLGVDTTPISPYVYELTYECR